MTSIEINLDTYNVFNVKKVINCYRLCTAEGRRSEVQAAV